MESVQSNPKVLIVVLGGVVQAVYANNEDIKIDLLDWDNEEVINQQERNEKFDPRTTELKQIL